jgi:hypothetical protein
MLCSHRASLSSYRYGLLAFYENTQIGEQAIPVLYSSSWADEMCSGLAPPAHLSLSPSPLFSFLLEKQNKHE